MIGLFILRRLAEADWDEDRALIVAANDVVDAREVATVCRRHRPGWGCWADPQQSTCEELRPTEAGVVLADNKGA